MRAMNSAVLLANILIRFHKVESGTRFFSQCNIDRSGLCGAQALTLVEVANRWSDLLSDSATSLPSLYQTNMCHAREGKQEDAVIDFWLSARLRLSRSTRENSGSVDHAVSDAVGELSQIAGDEG